MHFSLNFFDNDYYLLFMFILNCRNDVRQKAFLSNFLIRDQMGQKAAETILNINSASGPGTTNERPVQW